jgi:hypothetical protein
VTFKGGAKYRYDHNKPGAVHVYAMKTAADKGHGLGTYIGKHVKKNYAAKLV